MGTWVSPQEIDCGRAIAEQISPERPGSVYMEKSAVAAGMDLFHSRYLGHLALLACRKPGD